MKKYYKILIIALINLSFACSQNENNPPIQDTSDSLFSLEKVVGGIDIPWGLTFTDNNSFLVTDKKGILYHVTNGDKKVVDLSLIHI